MIPTGVLGVQILVRAWVPIDDEHVMFWSMSVPRTRLGGGGAQRPGSLDFLPDTTDWLGRFRLVQNRDNDYLIDREAPARGRRPRGLPLPFRRRDPPARRQLAGRDEGAASGPPMTAAEGWHGDGARDPARALAW